MNIHFTLNGRALSAAAPDRRAIDLIREEFGLTGTKEGCGSGECGACTILVDGETRLACLMLAAQLEGKSVTTIEGLAEGEALHPLQEAFVRCGAVQCGFCSPGMILAASALLKENPAPTRAQIREGLSGNLCRCTGYQKIVDAVEAAAGDAIRDPGKSAPPKGQGEKEKIDPPAEPPRAGGRSGRSHGSLPAGGRVLLPRSLGELWTCLEGAPDASLFAGGTDLFVQRRKKVEGPPVLIGLEGIAQLRGVRRQGDRLWMGACTTHSRLLREPLVRAHLPVLVMALESLGSPPIRNMGTLGGNICTASPAGDTLPPLTVLDAEVELCSARTRRVMPLTSFITGPGKTQIARGEILTAVTARIPRAGERHHFEKIGQRKALACAVASLAALIRISPAGVIEAVRLAWGSVGPTVVTSPAVEGTLIGERSSPALWEKAARLARQASSPIDDIRATADYRRTVSGNLLLRLGSRSGPGGPA